MGCIHEFYELPTIQLVAGSTEPLVFYCWHEITKDKYDVSGCTANFSIENYVNEEYVNDVKPSILTKPMTVDAANNAISVTLESFDTINIIPGEYIYQITLKDSLSGMVEIPHQGIIYIANNINKDFLLNGKYPTLFDTSDATATADDIIYPKTAYGPNGKITGNMQTVSQAVPSISVNNSGLITATSTQRSGVVASGTKTSTHQLPTKSSSSITVSGSTITIPAGYYPEEINKTLTASGSDTSDATATSSDILSGKTAYVAGKKITGTMPTMTLSVPLISVSSSGIITAVVDQPSGYVNARTQTQREVLSPAPGALHIPGTSTYTAVEAGKFTTGAIQIKGDPNLIPSNIKSGVTIFGVTGTLK